MRILVPVDFSECSLNALRVAASVARKSKGKIFLIHILALPAYFSEKFEVIEELPGGAETLNFIRLHFAEILKMPFMRGINAMEVILFENVYQTIVDFASENEIDLIVMGSHGASGFREFFIGSNTQKVVRTSECPVLTIKHRIERFQLKNVLFATDFSELSAMAFEKFHHIFRFWKPKYNFLKVITPDEFESTAETMEKSRIFAEMLKPENYKITILNHYNILDGISEYSNQIKPSLIALNTQGRTQLYQVFNESITEKLVNRSEYPVLSVKIRPLNE